MDRFITDLRRALTGLLREECSIPVYGWLPDDVAHLPVLVVGRPSLRESILPTVMRQECDITLLGRRINNEDAQAQLDALADETLNALGGTAGTKILESHLVALTVEVPATVLVAGNEYPAYLFTVAYDVSTC